MIRALLIFCFSIFNAFNLLTAQDIELKKIMLKDYLELGIFHPLQIEITNNGETEINNISITYQINDENVIHKDLNEIQILPGTTELFKIENLLFLEDGEYELFLSISLSEGLSETNLENNVKKVRFEVMNRFFSKQILIEHFTNASCASCSYGNANLFSILKEESLQMLTNHVAYHTSWPGHDPFYLFNVAHEQANARVDFYDLNVVPQIIVDGNKYQNNPINVLREDIVNNGNTISSEYLAIQAELTNDTLSMYIDVESSKNSSDTILLFTSMNEYKVYLSPPGYNGETSFPNAMRYMLPNEKGDSLFGMGKGKNQHRSYKIKLSEEVNPDSSSVLVFLQNMRTKSIVQAQQVSISREEVMQIRSYPINNSNNADIQDSIVFVFSQLPRDIDGLEIVEFSDRISFRNSNKLDVIFTSQYDPARLRLTIKPIVDLQFNSDYAISFDEMRGENNLILANFNLNFKTRKENRSASIEMVSIDNKLFYAFNSNTTEYDIALSDTATQIPVLKAKATSEYSTIEIIETNEIPGYTLIRIISEDGSEELEYRFNFYASTLSNEARLSAIFLNEEALSEFSPDQYVYQVNLSNNDIPTISAESIDANAKIDLFQANAIPGEAKISITAENGVSQKIYSVNFSSTVGIEEKDSKILIYPNPAENLFFIGNLNTTDTLIKVSIHNYLGEKLFERKMNASNSEVFFNIENLNTGIYLISLHFESGIRIKKLIKK